MIEERYQNNLPDFQPTEKEIFLLTMRGFGYPYKADLLAAFVRWIKKRLSEKRKEQENIQTTTIPAWTGNG